MSSIWDILGLLEPTQDESAIKKAYAKKLRQCRPEDDQDAFMQLREAFETAKNYASSSDYADNDSIVSDAELSIAAILSEESSAKSKIQSSDEKPTDMDVLIKKIESTLKSPWNRNSISAWQEIFQSEELNNIDMDNDFDSALLSTLIQYVGDEDSGNSQSKNAHKNAEISLEVAQYIFKKRDWINIQRFDHYWQHEIMFLGSRLGVRVSPPEGKVMTPIEAMTENEESSLFFKRMTICSGMLLVGLLAVMYSTQVRYNPLALFIGIVLILRAIRVWFITYTDHF